MLPHSSMSGYIINTPVVFPSGGSVTYQATSNQQVFGTGNTTTLSVSAPASSVTYTLPDAGGNANIILDTAGALTITNTPSAPQILSASSATQAAWVNASSVAITTINGTANQITANTVSGTTTLSIPATFIAPGTIQDTTGMKYSTTNSITAAGATQATATVLTTSYNVVTTVAASTGVALPTGTAGLRVVVVNRGANTLNVYPANGSGASIDGAAANTAVTLPVNASATYQAVSATQWYTVDIPLTAGTATSVTYNNGSVSVNNTGVTSIAGTANQVTASAATGSVTLSTPATFIAPGTIQDTTGMKYSTTNSITAAGATQATATVLTTSFNVVTTVAASTGVALPSATAGLIVTVVNRGANTLNVYPANGSGASIDGAAANAAVTLVANAVATYQAVSATQWYTVDIPVTAGAGITVTYNNGNVSIASSGVTSITGTANQITASASTGSVTLSTPATFIAPGTIQDTTGMKYSTTNSITAAGATQATATVLTTSYNVVTTVAASTGVALPAASAGLIVTVVNRGANTLNVYPANGSGASIDGAAANAAVTLVSNAVATYQAVTTTQWYTVDIPVTAGAGITVTYNNGNVSIASSGVTSITGTANQITASASTGAVTLSTPATFIAPGTIQDTTGMKYSTTNTISAAGATQATATALTTSFNVVTTVASNTGVALPTATAGLRVVVVNRGANTLNVYPANGSGAAIDGAAANAAVLLPANASATYEAVTATQWYTVDAPLIAGTSTTVTYGNGTVAVNNTGATSITGTANQITASASTGAVTLSTPATFIAPGTIQDTTGMKYSTTNTISAAGATQATATVLTTSFNVVTTVASSTGVALPTGTAGLRVVVVNRGANTLNVYPANGSGASIDGAAANAAVTLSVNAVATYQAVSATQWYTVDEPLTAGAGITVTYNNGNISIASSGVTSITGTANQITASASTGAVTLSTPATFIAPGTIQDTTGMKYSATNSITAAGATQATATALTTSFNVVTTVAASTGVALPTATAGLRVVVVNKGANTLNVYPANGSGASIDGAAANAAVTLAVNATSTYQAITATQWYTVDPEIVAGTNIVVTYGNGNTSVATTTTPTFVSETLTATTNQLVLGTTNTTTISATAPAASVTYTLADAGGNANIPLATNTATVGFVLTATGANSIATWQNPVVTGINKTLYLGTGNSGGSAVFTPPASTTQMYLTLVGGGGAGGGSPTAIGGGGGAAHAINKLPLPLTPNVNPSAITIGAGGLGAVSTGTTTAPGNSSFLFNCTIYNTGTAAATASTTITGTGTAWSANVAGGTFTSGATTVQISSWTSATSITVASAVTVSGSYNIYYNSDTMSSSGTVAQATTTITGTSTSFNSSMVNGIIVYSTAVIANITAFTSATSLTASQSQTVAGGTTYNLYYGTPQIDTGNAGVATVGTGGVSSTTVTGSGTSFTSAFIDGSLIAAGVMTKIVNVVSSTSLTVSPAVSIANGSTYKLYYSNSQTINYIAYGGGTGFTSGAGGGGGGAGGADTTGSGGPAATVWPQLGPTGGAGGAASNIGAPGSVAGFSVSGGGGGGSTKQGANSSGGIGGASGANIGGGGAGGFRGNGGGGGISFVGSTNTILIGTGAGSTGANPSTFTALTGAETNIFVSQFDYIYVGVNIPFSGISYADTTNASSTISPAFQYSLAGSTWTTISSANDVNDGTVGFTIGSGGPFFLTFRGPPYLSATSPWTQQLVNGTSAYWFRIQRTAVTVTTKPKATTGNLLVVGGINGGYSAGANTGAGGGGGLSEGGEGTVAVSGGDGGSGFCELWYE
jgi:hypothetical protein